MPATEHARHWAPPNSCHVITTILISNIWDFLDKLLHSSHKWLLGLRRRWGELWEVVSIVEGPKGVGWIITGSPQKISFRSLQPFRFKGFLLSRSCCFYAWCSVAHFLALKGVSTMTGKRNFEALQSPAFTSSWHSRNFLCHASSSSTVHHNALYCNTLHYNAMERRGRSYCWTILGYDEHHQRML